MKTIATNINKGGTGKSTVLFNYSAWLAHHCHKRVLVIDGDRSCNISKSLSAIAQPYCGNVFDIMMNPTINRGFEVTTDNTLYYVPGSPKLSESPLDLRDRQNNCMLIFMWLTTLGDQFDYVLFDTHNDEDLVTRNFLAASDLILGVSDPSGNGMIAWRDLQDTVANLKQTLVDPISGNTYVSAKTRLIANRIDHLSNSNRAFLDYLKQEPDYLGMIQRKELLNRSLFMDEDVFTQYAASSKAEQHRNKPFIDALDNLFQVITQQVN